jgi:Flp pilus assembly protein TadG
MLVLVAFCLPLCLIMAAFAVNVAWMQLTRTELRTATDSASRAGAQELSRQQSANAAVKAAKTAAARNKVAGKPLLLADTQIVLGTAAQTKSASRFKFVPGGTRLNAVRVTGMKTRGSPAGAVSLLMGSVLGTQVFQPQEVATSAQLDRDICLVLDRSTSMMLGDTGSTFPSGALCNPPDPKLSRWGELAVAVNAFLDEVNKTLGDEQLAMVSYGSDETACGRTYKISQVDVDLGRNYNSIRNAVAAIGSKPVIGFTAISAGLDDGARVLTGPKARPFAAKTMILMTDGLQNQGRPALQSAQDAAKLGIVIHTITFSADADQPSMQAVAVATGGKHFHAPDGATLVTILQEIANTTPVLIVE